MLTVTRPLLKKVAQRLRGPSVSEKLERYLDDPKNSSNSSSKFGFKLDFDEYARRKNGKAVNIEQWQSHYKNVIGSELATEQKVDLLILGGFPKKHKGGFRSTSRLTEMRIHFFEEVVKMVRP